MTKRQKKRGEEVVDNLRETRLDPFRIKKPLGHDNSVFVIFLYK
jgi:hypothetical protein